VVPLAFITYSLAFLDRNNFGYASNGMTESLKLTDNMTALLPAVFFIGYFLFQIPSANYASKHSVRWLVFWSLVAWGALSSLAGIIHSTGWLIVDRLLLGSVEGVVLPAMLVYLTRWFTKRERSRANSLLMLANPVTMTYASAASGFIIDYFDTHHRLHLKGWQWMFIIEGIPSIAWAGLWVMLAKDRPSQSAWLAPQEAEAVQRKLDAEQAEIPGVKNYWAAFADQRVIRLALMYIFFNAAGYAFMFWMPAIVKAQTGASAGKSGLLMAVPYLVASFTIVAVSWISDRTMQRKKYVWGSNLVGAIGYLLAALAGPQHFGMAFLALIVVGTCTYTPTSPQWAWMAEMLPRNVLAESMALVNSFGAVGGFLGVYFGGWLNRHFHSPGLTFLFCAMCLLLAAGLGLSVKQNPRTE
jgi:MFS family permease